MSTEKSFLGHHPHDLSIEISVRILHTNALATHHYTNHHKAYAKIGAHHFATAVRTPQCRVDTIEKTRSDFRSSLVKYSLQSTPIKPSPFDIHDRTIDTIDTIVTTIVTHESYRMKYLTLD